MLNLAPTRMWTCEGIDRRAFLKVGALSGLGLSLPALFAGKQAQAGERRKAAEVNCILIWTRGGTSHHDTFDPKPDAPASVRGEFKVIDTAVPGVKFTEILPRMARELKRYALLRSWNPKNGGHGVADQYCLSGHAVNPALIYPCYGAIVSHQKGFKTRLPPHVQLGDQVDRINGGGTAGYLGLEHNPFEILSDPNVEKFSVRDITPPQGIDTGRLSQRRRMLDTVDALQRSLDAQPAAFAALDQHYQAALNLITAPETKRAFEIDKEDARRRDRFGRTRFGQSCLLARRLIEAGVRFVTVSDGGWDTHANNFTALKNSRIPPLDQALPELLIDLAGARPAGDDAGGMDDGLRSHAEDQLGERPRSLGQRRFRHPGRRRHSRRRGARPYRRGRRSADAQRVFHRGHRRHHLYEARHSARFDYAHAGRPTDPPQRGSAHPRMGCLVVLLSEPEA